MQYSGKKKGIVDKGKIAKFYQGIEKGRGEKA